MSSVRQHAATVIGKSRARAMYVVQYVRMYCTVISCLFQGRNPQKRRHELLQETSQSAPQKQLSRRRKDFALGITRTSLQTERGKLCNQQ